MARMLTWRFTDCPAGFDSLSTGPVCATLTSSRHARMVSCHALSQAITCPFCRYGGHLLSFDCLYVRGAAADDTCTAHSDAFDKCRSSTVTGAART